MDLERPKSSKEAKRLSSHLARIGQVLDNRYELIQLLGHGGMGAVYKAKHIEMERIVAVKMLLPEVADDPEMCKRFLREAKASGKINHPNVVQLSDFGEAPGGEAYIVIEYLDGIGLDQIVEQQDRIEAKRAANIFIQICEGVGSAHAKGIIHRDLKPSNVMLVTAEGTADFVKVVDFGLAKALDPGEESQKLTNSGEIFGSPIYMSPEQCLGHQLDSRSDVYALGVLMYECLTGKVPFIGVVVAETIARQMNEIPKSFSEMRPDLNLNIPDALEAVVMKALSKNPEERQSSMQELKEELIDAMLPKLKAKNKKPGSVQPKMKPLTMEFNKRNSGELANQIANQDLHTNAENQPHAPAGSSSPQAVHGMMIAVAVVGVLLLLGAGIFIGANLNHPAPSSNSMPNPKNSETGVNRTSPQEKGQTPKSPSSNLSTNGPSTNNPSTKNPTQKDQTQENNISSKNSKGKQVALPPSNLPQTVPSSKIPSNLSKNSNSDSVATQKELERQQKLARIKELERELEQKREAIRLAKLKQQTVQTARDIIKTARDKQIKTAQKHHTQTPANSGHAAAESAAVSSYRHKHHHDWHDFTNRYENKENYQHSWNVPLAGSKTKE